MFRVMRRIPPIGYVIDSQVALTCLYYQEMLAMKQMLIAENPRVRELLDKYEIPYSLLGGAETYFELDGKRISEL